MWSKSRRKKDYVKAYSCYSTAKNTKDVSPNDILIPSIEAKMKELEDKVLNNQGIKVELIDVQTDDSFIVQHVMNIKYTNNSGRDIRKISGYYVAYDKEGYPLPVDSSSDKYRGYFSMNANVLKKGKSTVESAYPEVNGIVRCNYLITDIEYLNGGTYSLEDEQRDEILNSWENVVVEEK